MDDTETGRRGDTEKSQKISMSLVELSECRSKNNKSFKL